MKFKPGTTRESTNIEDRSDRKVGLLGQVAEMYVREGFRVASKPEKMIRRGLASLRPGREAQYQSDLVALSGAMQGRAVSTPEQVDAWAKEKSALVQRWNQPHHRAVMGVLGFAANLVQAPFVIASAFQIPKQADFRKTGHGAYARFRQGQAAAAQVGNHMNPAREFMAAQRNFAAMQAAKKGGVDTFKRTYQSGPKAGVTEQVRNTRKKGR